MRRRTRSWLLLCAVLTGMLGLGLGLTLARDIPVAALLPEYATGASRFIDVDGMKVHYRDEGSGPPLLLLHGTGASLHTFNAWAAALSPHFRVVRMDLPGFGLTGPSPGADYSIPAFVAFVESFRKAVGLERFALGGNSLGGQIAWSYAVQYPERVTELILVDSAGYPIHRPVLLFRLARTPVLSSLLALMDPGFLVKKTLHEAYGDAGKVTPELSERYRRLALREGNRAAFVARAQVASVDECGHLEGRGADAFAVGREGPPHSRGARHAVCEGHSGRTTHRLRGGGACAHGGDWRALGSRRGQLPHPGRCRR